MNKGAQENLCYFIDHIGMVLHPRLCPVAFQTKKVNGESHSRFSRGKEHRRSLIVHSDIQGDLFRECRFPFAWSRPDDNKVGRLKSTDNLINI